MSKLPSHLTWNKPTKESLKDWKPDVYITECCGSEIFSKYPGHFCECSCKEAFVDQTEFYIRIGGRVRLKND